MPASGGPLRKPMDWTKEKKYAPQKNFKGNKLFFS
jgi:hypothetical protein